MENFLTCQHFTSCKGQKHLDKNLYLQLQYILSPTIIFLCPLPSLTSPRLPYHLVFSPFCPTKQTQTEEVDELPWLSSCCRVGPAFPLLIGMSNNEHPARNNVGYWSYLCQACPCQAAGIKF